MLNIGPIQTTGTNSVGSIVRISQVGMPSADLLRKN